MKSVPFSDLSGSFHQRVERIVWCSVATQDRNNRLRSRVLHPIWEKPSKKEPFGWILTGRNSHKAKHLNVNPYITLSYWDPQHEQVYIDAKATWQDDPAEKARIWNEVKSRQEPYGYDPSIIWADGPNSDDYGVLEIRPWRVELFGMTDMITGTAPKVWRADEQFGEHQP